MTIKELKKYIESLPDDIEIGYCYCDEFVKTNTFVTDGEALYLSKRNYAEDDIIGIIKSIAILSNKHKNKEQ